MTVPKITIIVQIVINTLLASTLIIFGAICYSHKGHYIPQHVSLAMICAGSMATVSILFNVCEIKFLFNKRQTYDSAITNREIIIIKFLVGLVMLLIGILLSEDFPKYNPPYILIGFGTGLLWSGINTLYLCCCNYDRDHLYRPVME